MYRLISVLVTILLIVTYSNCYKWVPLKPGAPIPNNAAQFNLNKKYYVGRARHYNLLLPAEIYNSSHAAIYSCSKEIQKHNFEVLVMTEFCLWKELKDIVDMPLNLVRAGYDENGEPIFVGRMYDGYGYHLTSVLLTSNKLLQWKNQRGTLYYLVCNDNSEWVDTAADDIPKDAISGGDSEDGHPIFVSRLLKGCNVFPGQVIPSLGVATAVLDGNDTIHNEYCQVLIGDSKMYTWVYANAGEIPDYAVVGGKNGSELMYVTRMNKTLGYTTYKEASTNNMVYEFLVKNE